MLESGNGAEIGKGTQSAWNNGQGKSRRIRKKEEGVNSGEGSKSLKTEKRGKRKVAESDCSPEAKESEDKRKKNKRKEEETRDKYRAKVVELDQRKIKEIIGGGEEEKDTGKEADKVGEKAEEEVKMGESDDLVTLMKNMSIQMEEAKRERQAMRIKLEEIENGIRKQGKEAKGDIERLKAGMEKVNEEMKRKVDKLEKGLEEKKKEEERWRENIIDRLNRLEEDRAEKMETQEEIRKIRLETVYLHIEKYKMINIGGNMQASACPQHIYAQIAMSPIYRQYNDFINIIFNSTTVIVQQL